MEKEYEQQTKYKRTRTEGEKWGKGKDNTRGSFVAARQNYPRIFFLFHVNLSTPFPRNWLYWLEIFVSLFISPQSSLSLQFSHLVMSNSLWPHGLQHARLPCQSPAPRTCSNSCPLSRWCHPIISSSVIPFFSFNLPQHQSLFQWISFPHQVTKVLEFQLQHQSFQWIFRTDFPLGLADLISLQFKGLSRVFSNTTVKSINSLVLSFLYSSTLTSIHDYWKNQGKLEVVKQEMVRVNIDI